jgi:2-(1,2-epoxy-1,2-dihydrophenyl)acetyl-CoA isomerase
MVNELSEVIDDASKDNSVKVIVLKGSGKGFSAGGDLKLMEHGLSVNEARKWVDEIGKIILTISSVEKLVIASVNGLAYGAGCNLALSCDFIVASEDAKFCEVFSRIGLIPDAGGTYLLPRLVGTARAKELIFTTKDVTAQEAKDMGMIQYVVSKDKLEETTEELAKKLVKDYTLATGITKKLLFQGFTKDFAQALENEAAFQALCMETEEHKRKIEDFFEKRKRE